MNCPHKVAWYGHPDSTDSCPLEAPARKLIATMLTIKCADPSEANRLRQACDEMEEKI